jgi:hypothetical protein
MNMVSSSRRGDRRQRAAARQITVRRWYEISSYATRLQAQNKRKFLIANFFRCTVLHLCIYKIFSGQT